MPSLNWIGKEKVVNHHQEVAFRVLQHSYSFKPDTGVKNGYETNNGNKIIHGDNLEALKALLPEYEGKVDCIYIDPPYNTGNEDWVYNDNVNDPKIKKWLHQVVGKEGEDLSRHDKWLCMMYPRLKLLHKILGSNGAIFISIDDNEYSNLKLVMDEIFGAHNFITNIIWQKNYSPKNSAKFFSEDHDYILVYAKRKDLFTLNKIPRNEDQVKRYKNPDNDPRGPWKPGDISARNYYGEGTYEIITPKGRIISGPPKGSFWRISKKKFDEMDRDGRIWWGADKNNIPAIKRFLSEVQDGVVPQTLWKYEEVGHTQDAKKEFNAILHDVDVKFDTPKPTKLIERILQVGASADAVILDCFAGSGTTAHAALSLNKQDGGNRKFVLIEVQNYADNITAERVKRISYGYSETEGIGGSFDYYTLGEALFEENNYLNEKISIGTIRQYIYYSETKQVLDKAQRSTAENAYFLDKYNGVAYYFYYEPGVTTTLTYDFLRTIHVAAEQYVIYADNCLLSEDFQRKKNIIFKKITRDITKF